MANNGTIDYSGVTMEISGDDLIKILLPKIVSALANNSTLLKQLTASVAQAQLVKARATGNISAGYAGGNQQGSATKINQTSGRPR